MNTLAPFFSNPDPQNAVLLAIDNHKAGKSPLIVDWEYVDYLQQAASICAQHDDLVEALERISAQIKGGATRAHLENSELPRIAAILSKVKP